MIKDLVVHLAAGAPQDVAGPYAISIAAACDAHLSAVTFSYDPVIPPTVMGGTIPASLIDAQRDENDRAAAATRAKFDAAAQRAGIRSDSRILNGSMPGSADRFGTVARRFDLSVVGQGEPGLLAGPQELVIEAALFTSGRPVVVVPYIQKDGLTLDRVVVAWDGSRTAARAIGDAMPFLSKAKAIEVVIVEGERAKSEDLPGVDVGTHLARHGLKVEVKRIVASGDIASTLLSHVADTSADFVVMGGYGHSRLREFILGGATRGILSAMTVPVLMSH